MKSFVNSETAAYTLLVVSMQSKAQILVLGLRSERLLGRVLRVVIAPRRSISRADG
jgi:hypothetical protein